MKEKTCCFTGHRPQKLKASKAQIKMALQNQIQAAVAAEITNFISGMARGIDLWQPSWCWT